MKQFLLYEFNPIPLAAHRAADLLEYFHDVRVVWQPEREIQRHTNVPRHPRELGHRFL